METHIEYIKLFMEYEAEDMPVVYFYEVDLDDARFCRRAIEIYPNRQVDLIADLYSNVIEAVPIPPKEEFDSHMWGNKFQAYMIAQEEFEKIWKSGVYNGNLQAPDSELQEYKKQ